jgi:NAD-dependent SIR2 family protein deacetylase
MDKVPPSRTSAIKAIPSLSHMAIVELMRLGIVKYLISQNTDGLHRKSNVPVERFAELHGNQNLEQCIKCGREYVRDFRTRTAIGVTDHLTGRRCDDPNCRGPLKDTIINFGESLPRRALMRSFEEAEKADLCVVLGSSLTVTPAADIPRRVAQRDQKLVIVNLQITPLDPIATLKINGKTDDVMRIVMNHLNIPIPDFTLERRHSITSDQ